MMKFPRPFLAAVFVIVSLGLSPSATAAKPGEGIDDLLQAYSGGRGTVEATVQGLVKIMRESPGDPGVPKAFNWLIHNGGVSEGSDYDLDEAFLKGIESHHRDNDELAGALISMIGFREPEVVAFFERLGDRSESALVSGSALLALASSFEHDKDSIARYEATLEKLIKKHPALRFGQRDMTAYAEQKLYASQHLRIGKVAPEVEGEDVDGKRFKLSDYRGKVVFFNFWGDW